MCAFVLLNRLYVAPFNNNLILYHNGVNNFCVVANECFVKKYKNYVNRFDDEKGRSNIFYIL